MRSILITGVAGFIGFHTALRFIREKFIIVGIDNINEYYDITLKYSRLKETGIDTNLIKWGKEIKSSIFDNYTFIQLNIEDSISINRIFDKYQFEYVIHLAAQAGVRYSLVNPGIYIESNIKGFVSILEACRNYNIKHFFYASSSSVYGGNTKLPFSEDDRVDNPISLYAATKKSNELMAHYYSHLFKISTTGFRFFTVYGPWGRPDMAIFLFTKAILQNNSIELFNNGNLIRDFTFIDDIIECIYLTVQKVFNDTLNNNSEGILKDQIPYSIYNVGNSKPEKITEIITHLEKFTGKKALIVNKPMQLGDVYKTWADTSKFEKQYGYKPNTSIEIGISKFIEWYIQYYKH